MLQPIVLFFVPVALVFTLVHMLALDGYFYWRFWWFDILMHFWGGFLIAMGVVALTSFRRITIRPTFKLVLLITTIMVVLWEVFEWQTGIVDPRLEWLDTLLDITLGYAGSGLGYLIIKRFAK